MATKKTTRSDLLVRSRTAESPLAEASFQISNRTLDKTVFVELDTRPAKAKVTRDGLRVPSVRPDDNRLKELLGGLEIIQPAKTPRVVGQNIAPGTKVSVGTEVDLVMAPKSDILIGIFDDVHINVKQKSVAELLDKVKDSSQLRELVLKYEDPADIDPVDKTVMERLFKDDAGMPIDETKNGQRFRDGFNAMRAVYAFK